MISSKKCCILNIKQNKREYIILFIIMALVGNKKNELDLLNQKNSSNFGE